LDLYNMTGDKIDTIEVNNDVFGIEPNKAILHEVLVAELADARQGTAATKTRAMVRGGGRKPFDGKDEEIIVQKLENAFSSGATDEEACFYADISVRTLYYYCEKNPEFMQRKELLKKKLILQARNIVSQVMVEKDSGNQPTSRALDTSKWYLERKKKDEFAAQVNGIIDDGRSGGVLTEERKKAIADTMKAWSKNVKEDELDEDYDGKD